MQTLTPLVAKDAQNKYVACLEPVEACNLLLTVNPSTGVLEYTEAQGRTVREVRSQHWSWISLAVCLLAPFILYALYLLYLVLHEKYTVYQHVQWLTDFYVKNAPEVSPL